MRLKIKLKLQRTAQLEYVMPELFHRFIKITQYPYIPHEIKNYFVGLLKSS